VHLAVDVKNDALEDGNLGPWDVLLFSTQAADVLDAPGKL
jgi:hypothetical protein